MFCQDSMKSRVDSIQIPKKNRDEQLQGGQLVHVSGFRFLRVVKWWETHAIMAELNCKWGKGNRDMHDCLFRVSQSSFSWLRPDFSIDWFALHNWGSPRMERHSSHVWWPKPQSGAATPRVRPKSLAEPGQITVVKQGRNWRETSINCLERKWMSKE